MARALRLEFEDALYHVCARGNRRDRIYAGDKGSRVVSPIKRAVAEAL